MTIPFTPEKRNGFVADHGYDMMARAHCAPRSKPAPLLDDPEIEATVAAAEAQWAEEKTQACTRQNKQAPGSDRARRAA